MCKAGLVHFFHNPYIPLLFNIYILKEETRKLRTFEVQFDEYSVAGAIYSHGDVIDFVQGKKQGIVLVDTCGHIEEFGDSMAKFIRREIEGGWGIENDAEHNLANLGRKLGAMRAPGLDSASSDQWYDWASGSYTQFDSKNISLAMGGGIGETLILRDSGRLEQIHLWGGTIDGPYHMGDKNPVHNTSLGKNDVLLLQSDGLMGNIGSAIYEDVQEGKIKFDTRHTVGYMYAFLWDIFGTNSQKSPEGIRDALVSGLGKYFIPRDFRDDDVTFAVVKRSL